MGQKEIRITVEVGDNLRGVLERMLHEISRYSGPKETNEGLRVMGEILEKLLKQSVEGVQKTGYYNREWSL